MLVRVGVITYLISCVGVCRVGVLVRVGVGMLVCVGLVCWCVGKYLISYVGVCRVGVLVRVGLVCEGWCVGACSVGVCRVGV